MACRITKRQEWTFRIMLEARQHTENFFVTLTYSDENLPREGVLKSEIQQFMKRLRKRVGEKIRYFAVGEYGEHTGRAHYHLVLFTDGGIQTEFGLNPITKTEGIVDSDIHRAWYPRGIVDCKPILANDDGLRVAGYIAGYVTKKLTTVDAMEKISDDRNPEFSLMSRRPGIGLTGLNQLAKALKHHNIGPKSIKETQVGHNLWMVRFDGRLWPVNRVLRDKLVAELGEDLKTELSDAINQDQRALLEMLNPEAEDRKEERKARAMAMLKLKRSKRIH